MDIDHEIGGGVNTFTKEEKELYHYITKSACVALSVYYY